MEIKILNDKGQRVSLPYVGNYQYSPDQDELFWEGVYIEEKKHKKLYKYIRKRYEELYDGD